jgi:hypothetical protein
LVDDAANNSSSMRVGVRFSEAPRSDAGVSVMNAWILSLIICSAAPSPAGDYCRTVPLLYGVTRQSCQAELEKWRGHRSQPRLECIEDPSLVAALAEQEDDETVELDDSEDDDSGT